MSPRPESAPVKICPYRRNNYGMCSGAIRFDQLAGQLNIPGQDALSGLTSMLPQVVDKLTPDGQIPDEGVPDQGLCQLKEKLFR